VDGVTFVGYFVPIRSLVVDLASFTGPWQMFWTLFYATATYTNAGFLREQVCKYMCPYARFQSAMMDRDTLVVSYDSGRGEGEKGRSPRAKERTTAPRAWATALTVPCACRCARRASTSATACSTSALAAVCASTPATA
jgi:polyferredoxin